MSEYFCTNWNKTLVLASADVKTYTVQKGEKREERNPNSNKLFPSYASLLVVSVEPNQKATSVRLAANSGLGEE